MVATFVAAGGERRRRIAAAFDWQGVVLPANFRVDAWVMPPTYTGKPPVILPGLRPGEPRRCRPSGIVAVPVGSNAGRARDRQGQSRRDRHRRRHAGEGRGASAGRHRGASLHHHGDRRGDVRGVGDDLTWPFNAIPDKPPTIALTKDPEPQARGSLQLSYKLEDDYGVVEAHATFARKDAAHARRRGRRVRCSGRRISRWRCRRRAPATASARPSRI